MTDAEELPGTLKPGEMHPAAKSAYAWMQRQDPMALLKWREAFASTAMSGNRLADVCGATLERFMSGAPMSDRYLIALAWTLREMEDQR